jgi:hypothetical protein
MPVEWDLVGPPDLVSLFASLVDEQTIKESIDQTCFKTLEGNSRTKWHDNNIQGILSSQGF